MATDTTELTFVRCPSCRSLVPAVSTRCRMCGAGLEAGARDVAAEPKPIEPVVAAKPPASDAGSRVRQNTSFVAEEAVREPVYQEPPMQDAEEPMEAMDDSMEELADDPLSAYLQEVAVEQPKPVAPQPKAPEVQAQRNGKSSAYSHVEHQPEKDSGRKVITETGKGNKRGGLSFSKSEQPAKVEQPVRESKPAIPDRQVEAPRQEKREKPGVKAGSAVDQMLCGWLVSYSEPQGAAIELRTGKFFISGSAIKQNDLVLDDPSVSTPHAMANVHQGGVDLQDLMSDRGVFIRAHNQGAYTRVEERISLGHGDWLRIGDIEFLVVLIPSPGER